MKSHANDKEPVPSSANKELLPMSMSLIEVSLESNALRAWRPSQLCPQCLTKDIRDAAE